MKKRQFTTSDKDSFDRDGYVIVRSFFSSEEAELLLNASIQDENIKKNTFGREDSGGTETKLALWYKHGEDIYGAFSKNEYIIDAVEMLLGGRTALYHTKVMQKEPRVGGAWEWHQDYGYWYKNGFLFPSMMSVMIALTAANKKNGCLQVLKGSHELGRIEHSLVGGQNGADMERVIQALKIFELVYVELEPGDTLFFHGNLLHSSSRNNSEFARWSIISAYNLARNKPYLDEPVSAYTPVSKLPDRTIRDFADKKISADADFLNPVNDKSLQK
jgi:ectoine hydroxylase-related dioxygenase (phytanoyl-CoA dioxygenase family)